MWHLIVDLFVGAIAGWLAAKMMNTDSSNIVKNIGIGLIGGLVGGLIGDIIGIHSSNMLGSLIIAFLGACLVLWLYNKFINN